MALKDTKSPQEIIAEMKAEERRRLAKAEIEMEGATIRGAMPTFKNLTKTVDFGVSKVNPGRRDLSHPTGQIFTLPNGNEVVLVPEAELPEFLFDDTVTGKDTNERREAYLQRRDPEYDPPTYEEYVLEEGRDRYPRDFGEGVDARRVMVPEAVETLRKDRDFGYEGSFPVHYLGNGFFVLLGVEQQYQPDKSSFGTYEMTADGPVRTDDGEPTTKSIPIVFYSDPNKPIEYEAVDDYDKETETYSYVKDTSPSFGSYLLDPSRNYVRQGYQTTSDTQVPFYNVGKSEIKPELIPGFTGRDVIEGYKTAKAASKPAPKVAPPQEIEPAPLPEPVPEPPSSFQGFEMPVVDTLKGRRRKAKRRFSERQDLTDEQ
tara:strand:+ start:1125 stop:2243 length:1119 start_codon:yes stop_codon:yes gene_type:complete